MRRLAAFLALALAACTETPNVGAAYSSYAIALSNAANYAESEHAMANTVEAMADFNESPEMTAAVDHAEAYLICASPTPHEIPDYDCGGFDFSASAMAPVVKQLQHGSFTLRQATFAAKDMHGQETLIGAGHDNH